MYRTAHLTYIMPVLPVFYLVVRNIRIKNAAGAARR